MTHTELFDLVNAARAAGNDTVTVAVPGITKSATRNFYGQRGAVVERDKEKNVSIVSINVARLEAYLNKTVEIPATQNGMSSAL